MQTKSNFAFMSKVKALYHIVFCTKRREMTIPDTLKEEVYRFIWAEVKKHNSRLIRIGGISNHIHLLIELNPDERLSVLMRDIKANTSGWLTRDSRFTKYDGWARGYFAVSVSPSGQESVVNYINSQAEHHKSRNFADELGDMYASAGIIFDDRDLI